MSRLVEARELQPGDKFELPDGSACATVGPVGSVGTQQALMWCSHPPHPLSFDPPLIDLPPRQSVRLLSEEEAESHVRHAGYVEAVFRLEMARRGTEHTQALDAKRERSAAERRQRERAELPWWKKPFA